MSHTCPWWFGYFLLNPIRRLVQRPTRILRPFVRPGMRVVEPGCGMGFFTLDLVRMVGPQRSRGDPVSAQPTQVAVVCRLRDG